MTPDERRKKADEAAQLVAEGKLYDAEICSAVGIGTTTLWRWRKHPKFLARVDHHVKRINASLDRRAISHVERRVASLNARWLKLHEVIAARAIDPDHAKAPGGSTGLLAHSLKGLGSGENAVIVSQWELDTGLMAEIRAVEQQASKELGQWAEKHDHTTGGHPLTIQYVNDWRALGQPDDTPALPAPGPEDGQGAGEAV
jgi:hypothetical protein